ncbi:MAG: glycosyl hydrolase [Candidatus Sumerlaeota bacterium]|nr:glycosyl hydrolase [Candidatus Sumerlaeota bacterium]
MMNKYAMMRALTLMAGACWMMSACWLSGAETGEKNIAEIEKQFRELPMEARRLTGPLFWLHGDESKERLEMYLEKVAESGNGTFTAESRPHSDWLGEGWYRDLAICLQAAKKLNMTMWIFDEKWWPSQMLGGKVPPEYGSKTMEAAAISVEGPKKITDGGYGGKQFIGAVAGKEVEGGVDGASLVDLAANIKEGTLAWDAPAGKWKVMKFTWAFTGPKGMQKKMIAVDGADKDCVDWFIKTVYQPHYDRFKEDFGKTIQGYFYDEPETLGDWGADAMKVLSERKVDWKKALVAWKFALAGEEQIAAKYQYSDAFAEAWGRTMYGGMSKWCREHNVVSMGHFMEHGSELFSYRLCAGNMFQLQKYSDMGGIDLVVRQFYPGQKKTGLWQMAKLGSSITHVYNKADDVTMCEMFGAYGQNITYPEMKWLTDQMQVRGVNYMIPHSFNPRSPRDTDCPPYFYNGGYEPRYPLYRVYADYTNRLSVMLAGGRHVAPVAVLFPGQSMHAGKAVRIDEMTNTLDDALFDSDWMPYDAFEDDAKIEGKEIKLHKETHQVLVVPPVEAIPYGALAKAKEFFDKGGVVVGYGFLPSKSATLGKTGADIAALTEAIWGKPDKPSMALVKTSAGGGKSYFLTEKPTTEEIQAALTGDAKIHPALEVLTGKTDNWLHVLHRMKSGRDVFLVCNQNHLGEARQFRFRVTANGEPECWDPMRNEITAIPFKRVGDAVVEMDITLEPSESVLLVFQEKKRDLPARLEIASLSPLSPPSPQSKSSHPEITITRDTSIKDPEPPPLDAPASKTVAAAAPATPAAASFAGCSWVWFPEGNPATAAPPGERFFRGLVTIAQDRKIAKATFFITCDNDFELSVNGQKAGTSDGDVEGWRVAKKVDIAKQLKPGANQFAIKAVNATDQPSPAGLIGQYVIEFENGAPLKGRIDASWKASKESPAGWDKPGFDDKKWAQALEVAKYGSGPWKALGGSGGAGGGGRLTLSPVKADIFHGKCEIPSDVNLAKSRIYLEADTLAPEAAAHVTVNGQYAGGFIGKPFRLEVSKHLKAGANTIDIKPFAPKTARLVVY